MKPRRTRRKFKPYVSTGWAVRAEFDWGSSYLAQGWFGWPPQAPSLAGYRTAVFSSRKECRQAIKGMTTTLPRKAVQVAVTVSEILPKGKKRGKM